jgi:hypothetical protein
VHKSASFAGNAYPRRSASSLDITMTIWSLRKMQVYVFYAAHAAKQSVPWRISPNTAGIMTVSLVQTVFTLTTLCAASVVARKPISEPHLLMLSACTVVPGLYLVRFLWRRRGR